MSAPDQNASQRTPKDRQQKASQAANPTFVSLTRTLEDLEERLARLSQAKEAISAGAKTADAPADGDQAADESRRLTEERVQAGLQRLEESSSSLTLEIAGRASGKGQQRDAPEARQEAEAPRRRAAPSAIDRRFGTIAGEVEALQMQGATLRLITGVADDLQSLRSEIRDNGIGVAEAQFESVRASFLELRQMIEGRADSGRIGDEIAEILDRLSGLQATGVDRQSLETLRSDLDGVGALVSQMAREETLASVSRRWDEFESRLSERVKLDSAAQRDLRAELERLRETVRSLATEEQVRAVEQRWEEFELRHLDQVRLQTEEQLTRILKDELETLRARLDAMAAESLPEALAARLDALEGNLSTGELEAGFERLAQRVADLERTLADRPDAALLGRIEQRVEALSAGIADLAERQDNPDLEHFIVLEERLDEISQAIVASAVREASGIDMAPIERIEARIADLSLRVDALVADGSADILSERIAELSDRIGRLAAEPAVDLDERMQAFSDRFEALLAQARPADTSAFEGRLASLADRLEEASASRVDEDLVRSLEAQIQSLSRQLSGRSGDFVVADDPEMAVRLGAIERRLDENREELMAAARSAADEAVRLMMEEGTRRESEHVRQLSEDLRNLEALGRETDNRSIMVFEAVHSTLLKIVERLTTIEREVTEGAAIERPQKPERGERPEPFAMPAAAVAADEPVFSPIGWEPAVADEAPERPEPRGLRAAIARHLRGRSARAKPAPLAAEPAGDFAEVPNEATRDDTVDAPQREPIDAPSLDAADSIISREANRPLEPGSGAPDIASLLERVRQQQQIAADEARRPAAKADFIAAARKAAMAAAAEAEALRNAAADDAEGEPASAKDRLSLRRKPILMAVGAVLLALMAMPLGRTVLEASRAEPDATPGTAEMAVAQADEAALPPSVDTIEVASVAVQPSHEPAAPADAATDVLQPTAPSQRSGAPGSNNRTVSDESPVTAAVLGPLPAAPIPSSTTAEAATAMAQPDLAVATAFQPPAAVEPEAAEPAAVAQADTAPAEEPAAVADPITVAPHDHGLMVRALAALPETVAETLPAAPAGIGPTALVAAAESGDPKALFEIGLRLMEGRAGEPKPADALVWFAHSGKRGFAPAQYSLGTLYEKGRGVERQAKIARDWYVLAAEGGNVRAMHNLAVLYATGIDGRSEPETAARWFDEAARRGMRDSQYNLGILHARGAGVEQDFARSYKWFSIASQTGDKDALAKRDVVAKSLSAEERERIDAEVAAFAPMSIDEAANTVDIPKEWAEAPQETASVDVDRAIRNVQAILLKLGFDAGTPDGIVGERTMKAVMAFQEKNGMPATGEIDEALIRALLEKKDA